MSTSGTESKKQTERRKTFNAMRRIKDKLKNKKPLTEDEDDLFSFELSSQPGIGDKHIRTGWTQDEYTHGMSVELGEEWGKKYKSASADRKREIIEMYLNNEINPEGEGA